MLQDQSRNRTPMPAAQLPAGAASPEPEPARAEAGIARMLTEPAIGGPAQPDPILGVIEMWRVRDAALSAFDVEVSAGTFVGNKVEEEERLVEARAPVRDAVLATVPTTPAGRSALVQFIRDEIAASGMADGGPPDDDHPIWRDGLRALLAAQGETALRPGGQSDEDPIFAAIADHEAAYDLAVAAAEIPQQREFEAYRRLFQTAPTTFGGLAALARYLPDLIRRNATSGIGADCDALKALVTVCSAIGGIACSAEAAISLALRGLGGGAFGVAAPLEERRTRTDKYLAMMEADGFVPYPADNPRCLMAIELAIPLEAERLLAHAQHEFDRCAEAYADFPTPERDGHLARLRAEYRLDELADVVRGRACDALGSQSLFDQIAACWREWSTITDPDRTESEEKEARDALGARRYALIDAAEALPATMESLPVKSLALAWLEYPALWESEKVRDAYGTDGRLALDIDTAICGRLATEA